MNNREKHTVEPKERAPDVFDRECDECGAHGLKRQQVPTPDGPKFRLVCPECGHAHEERSAYADKR